MPAGSPLTSAVSNTSGTAGVQAPVDIPANNARPQNAAGQPQAWTYGANFNNPYGITQGTDVYGRVQLFGGKNDMMKTIATRNIGVQGLINQLNQPAVPPGLSSALQMGGQQLGGNLGAEEMQNIMPGINRGFITQSDAYKAQIANSLNSAYQLGGQIWGSGQQAWAQAKALDKARQLAHTQSVQAIVGSTLGALLSSPSAGGAGGGGGGGDSTGLTNLATGIVGVAGA